MSRFVISFGYVYRLKAPALILRLVSHHLSKYLADEIVPVGSRHCVKDQKWCVDSG